MFPPSVISNASFSIGSVSICDASCLQVLVFSPAVSTVAGVVSTHSFQSCASVSIGSVSATTVVSTFPKASLNTLVHPEHV